MQLGKQIQRTTNKWAAVTVGMSQHTRGRVKFDFQTYNLEN